MTDVGDHYRTTTERGSTVYRVVGASDEVTLLRVTDADGRRAATGEIRHVAPTTLDAEFEVAADPDAGLTPVRSLRNLLSGMYWSVRMFL